MRVLHVFGAMDVGGAEMRTLELMDALRDHDVAFDFLTLSGREGSLSDRISGLGGRIYPLAITPAFPLRLFILLRRTRPAVVDSHVATFSGIIVMVALAARVPRRIAHFRSDGDGHTDSLRRKAQRALMTIMIRLAATDIVGVSPGSLALGYRSAWARDPRARVVANGIAASQNMPAPRSAHGPSRVHLLHVGRPSLEKDRPRAVRVLAEVRRQGLDADLSLAGGVGPDRAVLNDTIASTGLAAHVHQLGQRSDARALMASADLLLLTSNREGLPGVVLEALSEGTPVVATDLPGVRFIGGRLPGVIAVPASASEPVWAEAVTAALAYARDPGWRRSLREQFSRSEFSLDQSVQRHLRLYSGTLEAE